MERLYDMIIIGSGPAGLAAAIYAQRARLDTLVIEKEMVSGGQVLMTYEVDNYPGMPGMNGFDLGTKFREHADKLGAVFVTDEVKRVETDEESQEGELLRAAELSPLSGRKAVICENGRYYGKTVVIATGARHQNLGAPGEAELTGMGVSYCATCDGAFFRNRTVAVVGGGDVALEDAIFLARSCEKVYLIHRRDELRGAKSLQETVFKQDNIEILWDTVVEEITGEGRVERLRIKNKKTLKERELSVQGVFIAVGIVPNSQRFEGLVDMEKGYIKAGEDGRTSAPGIFAAGDVRTKPLRQIVTAAADGANAVISAERYLMGQ
ncbi:MAG: thioredoxin-disulfide reductase [Hungatella sp.]|nr:thioredoxin-disulfide reductase [Hungatella sp.]